MTSEDVPGRYLSRTSRTTSTRGQTAATLWATARSILEKTFPKPAASKDARIIPAAAASPSGRQLSHDAPAPRKIMASSLRTTSVSDLRGFMLLLQQELLAPVLYSVTLINDALIDVWRCR